MLRSYITVVTLKYLDEIDGLDAPLLMHLAEEDEFISKPAASCDQSGTLPVNQMRRFTAIRVSITPSLGTMGRTTTLRRQRSLTGEQANSYTNNCGDLRSLQSCPGKSTFEITSDNVTSA